jgi:hypothetical protein
MQRGIYGPDKDLLTARECCAWLGLCPLVKQSGRTKKGKKKVKSAQTRRGRGRAAQALCLAASSLWQNLSALGSFLRRLQARLGPEKAVTAIGRTADGSEASAGAPAGGSSGACHSRIEDGSPRRPTP